MNASSKFLEAASAVGSISAALSGPAFVREGAQAHFPESAAGNPAYFCCHFVFPLRFCYATCSTRLAAEPGWLNSDFQDSHCAHLLSFFHSLSWLCPSLGQTKGFLAHLSFTFALVADPKTSSCLLWAGRRMRKLSLFTT